MRVLTGTGGGARVGASLLALNGRGGGMTGQSAGLAPGRNPALRASDIHDLGEQPEAHAPVAFGGVALDGGGFLVDADDGADALLQVLVGK